MNVKLQRLWLRPDYTLGALFVNGGARYFTLEDQVREGAGMPVQSWKVYGRTAIPVGRYKLALDMSSRFKRLLPHVLEVPGFSGIRVHAGNTADDTEGCILLGETSDINGFIGRSRPAVEHFISMLASARGRGEECTIEVANP